MPTSTRGAALVALALFGLAFADLFVAVRGDSPVAAPDDVARARARIEALVRPGDLLVHSPLLTVGELAGLGALPARPDLPPPALRARRRVLLLDRPSPRFFGFATPELEESFGPALTLRVIPPTEAGLAVVFELASMLEQAEMRVERPRGNVTSRCRAPRPEGGFSCPNEAEWLYLERRSLVIGGRPETCVWAHPTTGGAIVIALPAVPGPPEGKKLVLELSGALTDDAVSGTPDGAPVRIGVLQAGAERAALTVANRIGVQRLEAEVLPAVPVELVITTPRDGRRHHCVNAELREVPR